MRPFGFIVVEGDPRPMTQKSRPGQGSRNSERKAKGIMSRENATEKTSDFRRRTSIRSGGRCMRRPRGACIVASRGLELEVTIRGSGTLAASELARHCEATGVSLPRVWRAAADETSGTCGTNGTVGNARGTAPSESFGFGWRNAWFSCAPIYFSPTVHNGVTK